MNQARASWELKQKVSWVQRHMIFGLCPATVMAKGVVVWLTKRERGDIRSEKAVSIAATKLSFDNLWNVVSDEFAFPYPFVRTQRLRNPESRHQMHQIARSTRILRE